MSIELMELAAEALGPVVDDVVFVGGASVNLWITDPGAPPPRPTKDVDVVVEVTTLAGLDAFQARLRARGFGEVAESGVICRIVLPSARPIRAITPPYLVATKLEAFRGRGRGDYLTAASPHRIAGSSCEELGSTTGFLLALLARRPRAGFATRSPPTTSDPANFRSCACWPTADRPASASSATPWRSITASS